MTDKQYRLKPSQIAALAVGLAAALPPTGLLSMAPQLGIAIANHDVNTIANYDQGILPVLGAPFGSASERGMSGQHEPINLGTSVD